MSSRRSRSGGTSTGNTAQAIEEIRAEALLPDRLGEVAIGGGDQPDVGLDRLRGADPLELPLLQDAQQLHLELERQLADLVEEERSAVGQLEAAAASPVGAGEGTLLVAEELALDQARSAGRRS